ncbi:26477_t:CDS:2 [Dentiscutata erythropus]|uniref:26477_t:CDS:1 n=1 Tax=Dentiscutata erythropus TaxID=1348616 RepID=A0A9N9BPF3_9GLOM|nr:26477_t:CDS:2 [Dentiscutata erythropus]
MKSRIYTVIFIILTVISSITFAIPVAHNTKHEYEHVGYGGNSHKGPDSNGGCDPNECWG